MNWEAVAALALTCWVAGSLFVGAIGAATRGGWGFVIWLLAALIFSPPLALLGMIAVLIRGLEKQLEAQAEQLRAASQDPPTRFQQRFASLADDE
jgi:Na+/proline symporter